MRWTVEAVHMFVEERCTILGPTPYCVQARAVNVRPLCLTRASITTAVIDVLEYNELVAKPISPVI